MRRLRSWLAPLALFGFALLVRALPYQTVLRGEDVIPFENDSWYHLRRIAWSLVRFPEVLDFDRYINYPEGARPIWTPLFDWTLAALLRPMYRPGTSVEVERLAVWVPPVLGALTVVALYFVVKRYLDAATAVVAGVVLSVLSAHFWYSQIGFIDHHAAVALAATGLLTAAMAFLDRSAREASGVWRAALATGAAAALAILVWPGSLLHVAAVEVGLASFVVTRPTAAAARAAAWRVAAVQAVAFALVLPFCWGQEWPQWGGATPVVLSAFQPWFFGLLAAGFAACALLWVRPGLGESAGRRARSGALLALGLGGVALLAAPELRVGAADAWRWLFRAERFQAGVSESVPLLSGGDDLGLLRALGRLSGFLLLYPLAVVVALRAAWRRPDRAALLLWIGWSAALFAATLLQRRFFNCFAVALAAFAGWMVVAAWRSLASRAPGGVAGRAAARAAVAAAAVLALVPTLRVYTHHLRNVFDPRAAEHHVDPWVVARERQVAMARWIAQRTEPTSGWLDPEDAPEYGVLAPWNLGHLIEYVARRPTVTNSFGDDIGEANFERARRFWLVPEYEAVKLLEELRVRYVIVPRHADFLGEPPGETSMFTSLSAFDGTTRQPREVTDPPALSRHRLVFEVASRIAIDPDPRPVYRVFEFVPGAILHGIAHPRRLVTVELSLRTNLGRELVYRTGSYVDRDGLYDIRVPYATQGGRTEVTATGLYRVECGGETQEIAVPEWKTQRGSRIAVAGFCWDPPPRERRPRRAGGAD
jgi:dolichyl-diphosphooligosaccharide--protein glycosyltransferase